MIGKAYDRIESLKMVATKTEKKIIEKLRNIKKEDLIYMSIGELALQLDVAEATLLRFCRKLEYRGFQDFKLHLSQELGAVKKAEKESKANHVASNMIDAIMETYKQLDEKSCREVAQLIVKAYKVCVFGVGSSAIAPAMMKSRLIRAGLQVENAVDPHLQTIIASNLDEKDVIVLVSISGATKDILTLAETARQNKTPIVVITNYDKSPLAKYGDYVFLTCRKESAYEGGGLASVVAQSYIMDMICSAVFEILGEESAQRSLKVALAVSDKAI